jgi:hypothetical protein
MKSPLELGLAALSPESWAYQISALGLRPQDAGSDDHRGRALPGLAMISGDVSI